MVKSNSAKYLTQEEFKNFEMKKKKIVRRMKPFNVFERLSKVKPKVIEPSPPPAKKFNWPRKIKKTE